MDLMSVLWFAFTILTARTHSVCEGRFWLWQAGRLSESGLRQLNQLMAHI